jgi:hypothetical protein
MALVTFEGIVENGQIRLRENAKLPEHAKVYVLVTDVDVTQQSRVSSPRLANSDHVDRFAKEIMVVPTDTKL